jgi:hypothetical protein
LFKKVEVPLLHMGARSGKLLLIIKEDVDAPHATLAAVEKDIEVSLR